MSWHDLVPKTSISPETMEALGPVFDGQKLFNQGHYPEAEAVFCQALERFPLKSAGRVLIYNKLGILYEKIGDSRRALESYENGVQEGALTPFTYQRMCALHLQASRFPKALGCAQQGLKVLKKARTNLPQEIYFWFVFQKLKHRITRCMRAPDKSTV
jgi:tetratricopeptide (TPR) repeat protein